MKEKKQVSAKSELLLAASLCADVGKGLILALLGALILGRAAPGLEGVLLFIATMLIVAVLIGFAFYFTREAARVADDEEEKS